MIDTWRLIKTTAAQLVVGVFGLEPLWHRHGPRRTPNSIFRSDRIFIAEVFCGCGSNEVRKTWTDHGDSASKFFSTLGLGMDGETPLNEPLLVDGNWVQR